MLSAITGTLVALDGPIATLALGGPTAGPTTGLVLEAHLPAYAADAMQSRVGTAVTLHTRLSLESPNQGSTFVPRLVGFPDPAARAFYDMFTNVRGLGGRKALRAMAIEPGRIAAAIAAGDAVTLQKLPEIGKKLAQTIITELADKALALAGPDALNGSAPTRPIPARLRGPAADAIAALMALGQTPVEAEAAVARAASDLGREPENADELISLAFGAA